MTDSKAHPSARGGQPEDPLFDRDHLSNSDSEFLAELDRVLETEDSDQQQEPGRESELFLHNAADDALQSRHGKVSAAEHVDDGVDEIAQLAKPAKSAVAGDVEVGSKGTVELAAELDSSAPIEGALRERFETGAQEGRDSELRVDEDDAEVDEADTEPLPPAAQIPQPPPPWAVETPFGEASEQEPQQGGPSPLWVGAAALLALIGIAVGSVGLWQAGSIDERLSRLESALKPTGGPENDPGIGENAERIDELEQRLIWGLDRLSADLKGVKSSLNERVEIQKVRINEDLSDLNSTLMALQSQLESAEEMVTKADKRLQQAEQKPARVDPPVQREPPAQPKAVPAVTAAVEPVKAVADPKQTKAKVGGKGAGWTVNLWSFQRRAKAEQQLARIRGQDIPAEIFTVSSNGKVWHRIAVGGFETFEQAKTYAGTIRSKPGLASAWVGRN